MNTRKEWMSLSRKFQSLKLEQLGIQVDLPYQNYKNQTLKRLARELQSMILHTAETYFYKPKDTVEYRTAIDTVLSVASKSLLKNRDSIRMDNDAKGQTCAITKDEEKIP
jgi:hypothetical protein